MSHPKNDREITDRAKRPILCASNPEFFYERVRKHTCYVRVIISIFLWNARWCHGRWGKTKYSYTVVGDRWQSPSLTPKESSIFSKNVIDGALHWQCNAMQEWVGEGPKPKNNKQRFSLSETVGQTPCYTCMPGCDTPRLILPSPCYFAHGPCEDW